VDFDAQAVTATVRADSTRLRQVLIALLDNALHYTPAGGSIRLAARAEGGRTIITVTDTGRGIAPEHLAHVFDRFYRAERSAGESGAGLGLAVAKGLVEAQRGEIRIESQPGRGTTVSISLPTLTAGPS
jgi:signal transduction histidine kinase